MPTPSSYYKPGSYVIDIDEQCAPRKVIIVSYEGKKILGLLGTTDGLIIYVTDYNYHHYKPFIDDIKKYQKEERNK